MTRLQIQDIIKWKLLYVIFCIYKSSYIIFTLNNAILVDAHETHPKLDEYRAVLNELNLQYNTRLEIPIEDEVIVYENIKNLSLTEFRNELVLLCEAGIDFEKDFSNEAGVILPTVDIKKVKYTTEGLSGNGTIM